MAGELPMLMLAAVVGATTAADDVDGDGDGGGAGISMLASAGFDASLYAAKYSAGSIS